MPLIKLFTKPNCARCPQARALLDAEANETDAKVERFDVSTDEGLAEAAFHEVIATPTILVLDEDEVELVGWRGEVPSASLLREALQR